MEGKTLSEMAKTEEGAVGLIKYSRGLQTLRSYQNKPRQTTQPPTVIWIYGKTGTGKTRAAVEETECHGISTWMSSGTLRWFDGYDGQEACILDDIRTSHCKFDFLLRLLDRYPFRVEFKGGSIEWSPRIILITAPWSPADMWNLKTVEQLEQLERRITHKLQFPDDAGQLSVLLSLLTSREVVPIVQEVPTLPIDNEDTEATQDFNDLVEASFMMDEPWNSSDDDLSVDSFLLKHGKTQV
jgi:hypothetical protein